MNKFLVMISLLMFLLTDGNAWSQIRPVPTRPTLPTGPTMPTMPTTPTLPSAPTAPTTPTMPPGPTGPTMPPRRIEPPRQTRPTMISVPEVRGYTREQAETMLKKASLALGEIDEHHSDQPRGTVIGQKPEPGDRVKPHSSVNLMVAIPAPTPFPWGWVIVGLTLAGLGGYYLYRKIFLQQGITVPPPAHTVPPPHVEIRTHQRAVKRMIICDSLRLIDLEVGLRPVSDLGTQDVEVEGSLILEEQREHE